MSRSISLGFSVKEMHFFFFFLEMIKEIISATNLICRARNRDADVANKLVATGRGGEERMGQVGRAALASIYTHYHA